MVARDFAIGNTRIIISLSKCVDPEQGAKRAVERIARTTREQLIVAEKRGYERHYKGRAGGDCGGGSNGDYDGRGG